MSIELHPRAVQRSETFMRELAAVKGAMRAKASRQKSGLKRHRRSDQLDPVDEERAGPEPMNLS